MVELLNGGPFIFIEVQTELDQVPKLLRVFERLLQMDSFFLYEVPNVLGGFVALEQGSLRSDFIKDQPHLVELRLLGEFIAEEELRGTVGRSNWLLGAGVVLDGHREISDADLVALGFLGDEDVFGRDGSVEDVGVIEVEKGVDELDHESDHDSLLDGVAHVLPAMAFGIRYWM